MDETLSRFESELNALLSHLTTAERKKIAKVIGHRLRQSQCTRVRAQQNPDGSSFQPRKKALLPFKPFLKAKKTRITARRLNNQQRMFKKLATARFLRLKTDSQGLTLSFLPSADRIAQVHHFGLTERYHGKTVHYPARQLLGLTAKEMIDIENQLLDFLIR